MLVEFGNYIGADLESDDESDIDVETTVPVTSGAAGPSGQASGSYAPLEGLEEEDEDMEEDGGMEMTLHGVDGQLLRPLRSRSSADK